MNNLIKLALRQDVNMDRGENFMRLSTTAMTRTFPPPNDSTLKAFKLLQSSGASQDHLFDMVLEGDNFEDLMRFSYLLKTIDAAGFLTYHFELNPGQIVKLVPLSSNFEYKQFKPLPETRYQLSSLSLLRKEGSVFLFESPMGKCHFEFSNHELSSLLLSLYEPALPEQWMEDKNHPYQVLHLLLEFLYNMNCLQPVNDQGNIKEKELENPEAFWEFHDLYFHSRSRLGRHKNPYGGTFPFGENVSIPPAVKSFKDKKNIALHVPDLEALKLDDCSLTEAIESRESIRAHGKDPITRTELATFLYRTCRVTKQENYGAFEFMKKNYPSGGGLYEIEVYAVVNRCTDLAPGIYYYNPKDHQMTLVREEDETVKVLSGISAKTAGMNEMPQILLVFTARFRRLSHKYRSVTYALILKHVGVLYQQMYLVATAMGLAPCALGGGDADLFSTLIESNYLEESSVGEFLLGSK